MRDGQGLSLLKRPAVRLALVVIGLFLLALVFYVYQQGGWRDVLHYYKYFFEGRRLRALLASFGPYSAVAFTLLQVIQVVVAPVPGEVTGFVGGLLFGKLYGTLLSTFGLTIGSLFAFWFGRRLGSAFVRKVVRKEYYDRFDSFMASHRALNIAFVLFLIPGFPKDSLCYLLGLTRVRYVDFILLNVLGRLPGTFLLCMQGDAIRHGHFGSFWLLFGGSLVLTVCLYAARNGIIRLWGSLSAGVRSKEAR